MDEKLDQDTVDVRAKIRDRLGFFKVSDDERAAVAVVNDLINRQFTALRDRWNVIVDEDDIALGMKFIARDSIDSILDTLVGASATIDFLVNGEDSFNNIYLLVEEALNEAQQRKEAQDATETADEAQMATDTVQHIRAALRADDMIQRRERTPSERAR